MDDVLFDAHYGYWFNLACERFYKRIDTFTNFVQLVGGSGAALAAINGNDTAVVLSGLALATCAAISVTVQPAVKAEQHRQSKCEYLGIQGDVPGMTREQLGAAVRRAQRSGPAGIGALATPAFNATLNATGRDDGLRPLSLSERVARALA